MNISNNRFYIFSFLKIAELVFNCARSLSVTAEVFPGVWVPLLGNQWIMYRCCGRTNEIPPQCLSVCVVCTAAWPALFISRVNDCPARSDTVMLRDRLIYLLVSRLRFAHSPPIFLKAFRSCLIFLFFNLNLNSPLDSAARQNKLFKSFNEEVQSTDAGVQTHLEQR